MKGEEARVAVWRAALLVGGLLSWELLTWARWPRTIIPFLDPFFISSPSRIARRFLYHMSSAVKVTLLDRVLVTVQNTILGFLVGTITGFLVGLYLGRHPWVARVFEPYIIAANTLPRIALVPLVTMLFGFGWQAKVVMAWLIVFFIVFFNTFEGARSVDPDLINTARILGASSMQVARTVVIPATLAWTFTALTPSISFALIGVVIAEFIGGESGIGYLIISSLATLEAADMMVALIALAAVGILLALAIRQMERHLLRWHEKYLGQEKRW